MKLTIAELQKFIKANVPAANQAAAWKVSTGNFAHLVDKIGKMITLDGVFADKLTEMDGEELPLGKTIEEYFIDLTLPTVYTDASTEGAKDLAPAFPTVEDCTYNYTLGKTKIKTSIPYNDYERACNNPSEAANISAKIVQRLSDSYEMQKFGMKKQLLANVISKASAATNAASLVSTLAVPTDATTGEAFMKEMKVRIEDASFATEGNNLGNYLIGAAPSLKLYVKKGVIPSLEVDTLSGAFHDEKLAIPASIEVVDDFGNDTSGVYAILMDTRMCKLHPTYKAIRTKENADGDFVNYVLHAEHTGYISKSTYVHCFKAE